MRDLLKTVLTSSMVAGAALLVAACGGGEQAEVNNTAATDVAVDELGNDVTAVDATAGADANLVDTNATMDANVATNEVGAVDANVTNGM